MPGFIKLYRKVVDSDIYKMPPLYLRVFVRLLLEANHSDTEIPYDGGTRIIKRGQRLTSMRQICGWVAWYERGVLKQPNPKTIREILRYLERKNAITICRNFGNTKETLYTICNYEVYQGSDEDGSNAKVTVKKQRADINKNDKNDNTLSSDVPDVKSDKQKSFEHDSYPYRGALLLDKKICERMEQRRPSDERTLQRWADSFDKLNRIDGYAWELISDVLKFSQKDTFWQKNILSGDNFRKKFESLYAKMGVQT